MDTLTAIFTRRSTRHFDDRPIEDDKLRTILEAAMSGPSCVNSKDWAFIVVTERETLDKMAEANGRRPWRAYWYAAIWSARLSGRRIIG